MTQPAGALVLRRAQQPGYLGSGTGPGTGGEARVGHGRRVAAPGSTPSLLSMAARLQQPYARKDFKAPWERVRGLISDVCRDHGRGERWYVCHILAICDPGCVFFLQEVQQSSKMRLWLYGNRAEYQGVDLSRR